MDREILRALAGQIAEIAALPVHAETAKLYRAVNGNRMIRPVVLLDELPWNQLNADGALTLQCEDPILRGAEEYMRKTLWKWEHCRADMLVEPFFPLYRCIQIGEIGPEVKEDILDVDHGNNIVSHYYLDQLPDYDSLEKIREPEIIVDDAETERRRALLDGVFGDILPIRLIGVTGAGYYCPWDNIPRWRGVENTYVALYDEPEFMHAIIRRYCDIHKSLLTKIEDMGLMDDYMPVLHCTAGLVDDLPGTIENGKITRKNCWGRGMAQMFAEVSPAMTDEFEIQYAKEFFDGFGLLYYGCCEPLHNKVDVVKKLPNLRKLSITPWANVRMAAEQMGSELVLSRKPNPASVAVPKLDEVALRKDILETLQICRDNGTSCEFVLKDISSVHYNPENLTNWEKVVMETVKNF